MTWKWKHSSRTCKQDYKANDTSKTSRTSQYVKYHHHIRNMRNKKILHDFHDGIPFTLWTSITVPFSPPTKKKKFNGKEQSPFSSKRMTEVSTQFILTARAILNLWEKESMNSHTVIIQL